MQQRSTLPQPGCVLLVLLLCFPGQCVRPHTAQEDFSLQWDPAAELGGAEPAVPAPHLLCGLDLHRLQSAQSSAADQTDSF